MKKFSIADGGSATGEAVDRVGLTAGTLYLAKYWNDNFFNIFNMVEKAGYTLIDGDLEQLHKAIKGLYVPTFTYNTSAIATQTVNDIVLGSNGAYYQVQADAVIGDDPVGSITGNWMVWQPYKTGQKNLLINGRKLIQQRGVTGGRKQVILNTANLGGNHTISWVGSATVTIKEATTLAASDTLTTWDAPLVAGASSGSTITLTAGKYVHVEFSTTIWDFAQLEPGNVATNFDNRHNEFDLCLPFFQDFGAFQYFQTQHNFASGKPTTTIALRSKLRVSPLLTYSEVRQYKNSVSFTTIDVTNTAISTDLLSLVGSVASVSTDVINFTVYNLALNAEIFNADDGVGINYKEDRWYV